MTTFFAGDTLAAADVNSNADVPVCHLVQPLGSAQTGWTTATPTAITFGTGSTVVDTASIHSESSNTSRLVIGTKLGWWQLSGIYVPAVNTAETTERVILYKNGSAILGSFNGAIGFGNPAQFAGIPTPVVEVQATSASDYVEMYGYQTAASGTIGTATSSPYVSSSIRARWDRDS